MLVGSTVSLDYSAMKRVLDANFALSVHTALR
jgi:hypothetical protein